MSFELVLGSASPRRREILNTLGIAFRVVIPDVDESALLHELPLQYVERVARRKCEHVFAQVRTPTLCADTVVIQDEKILGKPTSRAEHREFFRALRGRGHTVATCVAIQTEHALFCETVATRVFFRAMHDDEIEQYCNSGEGDDKAGGYAIQGRAMGFVERIEGSYTGVVGLPAETVVRALRAMELLQGWP